MTQKFKVGDKVRIVNPIHSEVYNGYNVGDVFKVKRVMSGSIDTEYGPRLWYREVEKVLKKNERISALEAQVAELTAKVEALEKVSKPKYTLNELLAQAPKSTNEQRKAIIAEAKAFIDDSKVELTLNRGRGYEVPFKEGGDGGYICDLEFVVNAEKRTVVALLRWTTEWESHIKAKGIAKCAPDDVFNADIGKAIALGRALGLDVERFEQAVKPTEHVNGMLIAPSEKAFIRADKVMRLANRVGRDTDGVWRCHVGSKYDVGSTIIDDTDAQY